MAPRRLALLTALALLWAWSPAQAKPGTIAIVAHKSSKVDSLTAAQVREIFLKKRRSWPTGQKVIPFNATARSPLRRAFDRQFLYMNAEQVGRYWVNASIRGQGTAPRQLPSSMVTVQLVAALKGAIGYVELKYVSEKVKVLAVDGKQPTAPDYKYRIK